MKINAINNHSFNGRIKKGDVDKKAKKITEEKIKLPTSQQTDVFIAKSEDSTCSAIVPAATTLYIATPITAISQA